MKNVKGVKNIMQTNGVSIANRASYFTVSIVIHKPVTLFVQFAHLPVQSFRSLFVVFRENSQILKAKTKNIM